MLQTFFAEDLVQANHRIKFTTNEQPLCIQRVFNKLKGVQRLLQTQSFGQSEPTATSTPSPGSPYDSDPQLSRGWGSPAGS
jgi:hypothetical protein